MFEYHVAMNADSPTAAVESLRERVVSLPAASDDRERVERIVALDRLKAACAAVQAGEAAAFAASQRERQEDEGAPPPRLGRGIADQLGLARRISPTAASRWLHESQALVADLSQTRALLAAGEVSEQVAHLVARESDQLTAASRRRLDADLAGGPAPDLPGSSPREAIEATRRHAFRLEPEAVDRRARVARGDRGVQLRPGRDTMVRLCGHLPAEQGVLAWRVLDQHAKTLKSSGDARTLGQIRADAFVERLTGQVAAADVGVEVGLTMTLGTLFGDSDDGGTGDGDGQEPADLLGYGPIPTDLSRDLVAHASARSRAFLRRVFTDPVEESVAHVDTGRRRFDGPLARLIGFRDQRCADPGCDAPIRHVDHLVPHAAGGATSAANGQGRCERGNYVKDTPGWSITPVDDGHGHGWATIITPTGHEYPTRPPPARGPGANRQHIANRRIQRRLRRLQRELHRGADP